MAQPGRILLFGATGYTGALTAHALNRLDVPLTLVGRSAERLTALAEELRGHRPSAEPPELVVADARDTTAVRSMLRDRSDVLVSTVGPFMRLGLPALTAATDAGARYVDSTGEGPFIRRVFEDFGPRAQQTGASLLTAFGYDYVPGNLAGALALRDAESSGSPATRIEIGYFIQGPMRMSSGTRASIAAVAIEPSHGFREGKPCVEPTGARTAIFSMDGKTLAGLTIGSSEHYTLPRFAPGLRDIDVYLGWAGSGTLRASARARRLHAVLRIPGARPLARRVVRSRTSLETGRGPNSEVRAQSRTIVFARTFDDSGRRLSHVRLEGPSPYDLTAELLAWAAVTCLFTADLSSGALGPVDAFGLDETERACAQLGLRRTTTEG